MVGDLWWERLNYDGGNIERLFCCAYILRSSTMVTAARLLHS